MSKEIKSEDQEIHALFMKMDERGRKLIMSLLEAYASKDNAAVKRAKDAIHNEYGIDTGEVRA